MSNIELLERGIEKTEYTMETLINLKISVGVRGEAPRIRISGLRYKKTGTPFLDKRVPVFGCAL